MSNFFKPIRQLLKLNTTVAEHETLLKLNDENINTVQYQIASNPAPSIKRKLEAELGILKFYQEKIKAEIRKLQEQADG